MMVSLTWKRWIPEHFPPSWSEVIKKHSAGNHYDFTITVDEKGQEKFLRISNITTKTAQRFP